MKEYEQAAHTTKRHKVTVKHTKQGGNAVYGLGLIGAAVYFLQNADSFWIGVLGLLKALVWPAYVVYKLLESFYG